MKISGYDYGAPIIEEADGIVLAMKLKIRV
jgi:hypothetical protein